VGNDYLVEQGLGAGERIIAEGVIKVRPGLTVRVRGEEPKPAQPAAAAQASPEKAPAAAQNGEPAKAEAKENRS
jgi:membrane fusion protein (multidrug efflux system)